MAAPSTRASDADTRIGANAAKARSIIAPHKQQEGRTEASSSSPQDTGQAAPQAATRRALLKSRRRTRRILSHRRPVDLYVRPRARYPSDELTGRITTSSTLPPPTFDGPPSEFCTDPPRSPENQKCKRVEYPLSRGPPLIHALRSTPTTNDAIRVELLACRDITSPGMQG